MVHVLQILCQNVLHTLCDNCRYVRMVVYCLLVADIMYLRIDVPIIIVFSCRYVRIALHTLLVADVMIGLLSIHCVLAANMSKWLYTHCLPVADTSKLLYIHCVLVVAMSELLFVHFMPVTDIMSELLNIILC